MTIRSSLTDINKVKVRNVTKYERKQPPHLSDCKTFLAELRRFSVLLREHIYRAPQRNKGTVKNQTFAPSPLSTFPAYSLFLHLNWITHFKKLVNKAMNFLSEPILKYKKKYKKEDPTTVLYISWNTLVSELTS